MILIINEHEKKMKYNIEVINMARTYQAAPYCE